MPHKKAKRSVRQNERTKQGSDLPPSASIPLSSEVIPKSVSRVLQAESLRKSYREKRKREGDDVNFQRERAIKRRKSDEVKNVHIKHGESLVQFNRRVEEEMRMPVAEAMRSSRKFVRKVRKEETKAKHERITTSLPQTNDSTMENRDHLQTTERTRSGKSEFERASLVRRVNDVVQEPPVLTKLPRGTQKHLEVSGNKTEGVVSMVQKQMMEVEREKAIKRYRELRERRSSGKVL